MSAWLWCMAAGSAVIFALYGLRCAKAVRLPQLRKHAWGTALLGFFFSAVFGTILARVGYALLMLELDFEYDGIAALEQLLDFEIDCVSFLGGALGVLLGVLLANRLLRKGFVIHGMDAFAPFGALLAAVFRMGECFFGSYGTGGSLAEGNPLAFFPLALEIPVDGGYSNWNWAVCVLSAVFAVTWAAFAFFRLRSRGRAGLSFTLTLFFLALPQVLCESMRQRGMFWLFVHTEQLLCAVVLLIILLFWILRSGKGLPFLRRWWSLGVLLLGAAWMVFIEFAIDGSKIKIPNMSHPAWHMIMAVILAAIGFAGAVAAKRWDQERAAG